MNRFSNGCATCRWPIKKRLVPTFSWCSGSGRWESPWWTPWAGDYGKSALSLGDRIARTFFIVVDEEIILLHGIIKKSRTAPKHELDLARKRQTSYMKQHRK